MGNVLAAAQAGGGGSAEAVVFWVLAPVAVLAALAMVLSRNAVHGALFLVADFFCLAVMYLLLDAQFLFAVQIIVYTGAIMVLFLFVLMLLNVGSEGPAPGARRPIQTFLSAAALILFTVLLLGLLRHGGASVPAGSLGARAAELAPLARLLFSDYLLPFEALSVLLLAALVGAFVLARREGNP